MACTKYGNRTLGMAGIQACLQSELLLCFQETQQTRPLVWGGVGVRCKIMVTAFRVLPYDTNTATMAILTQGAIMVYN